MPRRHSSTPRTYDELVEERSPFPASALYHENTKLTAQGLLRIQESIARASTDPPQTKSYPSRPTIPLARHKRALLGGPRLDDVVRARRSRRGPFSGAAIEGSVLGSLLDLALGPSDEGLRAWPSAGALYPLETYLVTITCDGIPRGVHHYDPIRHVLATLAECPTREDLARLAIAEQWETASAALIFCGVFERTQTKYGERGYRFVHIEAGHAAQNVLLVACALGLSTLPLGGFSEDPLGELLGLDPSAESPVYVVLLGK